MSARAFRYDSRDDEIDHDGTSDELVAGDRVGAPAPSAPRSTMLSASIVIVVASIAGYAIAANQAALERAAALARAALATVKESNAPPQAVKQLPPPPNAAAPPAPEPFAEIEVKPAPAAEAGEPALPLKAAEAPDASADEVAASAALPQPIVDPQDRYQKRAVAVGLHPSLSRALLARLSPADYRNAEHAIKTALSNSTEGDVFVWPKAPASKLATFEVRFVQGAPASCRRYVVIVTKDHWATTAAPMERCGEGLEGASKKPANGKLKDH